MSLQIGRAAEMRAPMAVVVIGGLILSTMLTLLVIPVMYSYMDDLVGKVMKLMGRKPAPEPEQWPEDLDQPLPTPRELELPQRE